MRITVRKISAAILGAIANNLEVQFFFPSSLTRDLSENPPTSETTAETTVTIVLATAVIPGAEKRSLARSLKIHSKPDGANRTSAFKQAHPAAVIKIQEP